MTQNVNNLINATARLDELKQCVASSTVFMDSCSLMQDSIETFEDYLVPLLYENNTVIVIPMDVYNELRNKFMTGNDDEKRRAERQNQRHPGY